MLQISVDAIDIVDTMRAQRDIPSEFGLRVYADRGEGGRQAVRLGFAEEPAEGDEVSESSGLRLFVAAELKDALSNTVIDVDTSGADARLVLRPA